MNVRVIPHKRGNGKWAVDYRCPVTKARKYESFDTKAEAKARNKIIEGEHEGGSYRPVHRRTWARVRRGVPARDARGSDRLNAHPV